MSSKLIPRRLRATSHNIVRVWQPPVAPCCPARGRPSGPQRTARTSDERPWRAAQTASCCSAVGSAQVALQIHTCGPLRPLHAGLCVRPYVFKLQVTGLLTALRVERNKHCNTRKKVKGDTLAETSRLMFSFPVAAEGPWVKRTFEYVVPADVQGKSLCQKCL